MQPLADALCLLHEVYSAHVFCLWSYYSVYELIPYKSEVCPLLLRTPPSQRGCFDGLRPQLEAIGCGWRDLLWAVSALHSRCFFDAGLGLHLSVPGEPGWQHYALQITAATAAHSVACYTLPLAVTLLISHLSWQ